MVRGVLLTACNRSTESGPPPSIRYPNHVAAGGSQPPAAEMKNPFADDSGSAADGSKIFSTMNATVVTVAVHSAGSVRVSSTAAGVNGGTDGALYQSIFYGRPRGMPAYGGVMSPGAIWKVVTYIRSQPVPSVVPTQRWPNGETAPRPAREQSP
jgi:cytochrome c oxidase cbb3-type subunit 3